MNGFLTPCSIPTTAKPSLFVNRAKRRVVARFFRLAFHASFYLNRSVSAAEDEVSSWTAFGPAAAGQHAAASFITTHWSVVLEAQDETPAAQRALEILCRTYWRPLYGFARRQGLTREEAQDLIQEFFARLLEHRNLDAVRREKGRLRSYLLVSLKRFLATERHRASGVKRYESGPHIQLDELLESEVVDLELTETWSADRLYERHWALAVLGQVLGRLESEYQAAGNAVLFDRLKEFLVGERGLRTQAEIATELGMTENAVKQAFHRFRQCYRVLLREEIAHTVIAPGDVEDELRHLVSVLRR
jgi:RNA polymerase sigma factor (sigma-70 family)